MKWTQADITTWYQEQKIKRSYEAEVVAKIQNLKSEWDVDTYGALSLDPKRYPLFLVKSKTMSASKKTILITGGVHGYETSGVQGALGFMLKAAKKYETHFNFVCAPCISPWSYETINRWNSQAIDPNRSFRKESLAEECQLFLTAVSDLKPFAHFDLHETTDTDNTIFRPALAQRDGTKQKDSPIPDGFYLVGDSANPQKDFQRAIIDAVRKVTHIAPSDNQGQLIGDPVEQEGVINYPLKKLFLCAGFFDVEYSTTTEVYPDSPKITDQICIDAQITAIGAGLDFIRSREK